MSSLDLKQGISYLEIERGEGKRGRDRKIEGSDRKKEGRDRETERQRDRNTEI